MAESWFVYILHCGDGSLYTGITQDVNARLEIHRSGKGAKYTRGRGPMELVYTEECASKSAALKRELAIKGLPRQKKLELIGCGGAAAMPSPGGKVAKFRPSGRNFDG